MADSHSRDTRETNNADNATAPPEEEGVLYIREGEGGITFSPVGHTENPNSPTPTCPQPEPDHLHWVPGRGWTELLQHGLPVPMHDPERNADSPTPPHEPEPGYAWEQGWGWLPLRWIGKVPPLKDGQMVTPEPASVAEAEPTADPEPQADPEPEAEPEPEPPRKRAPLRTAKGKKSRAKAAKARAAPVADAEPTGEAEPLADPAPLDATTGDDGTRAADDSTHPRIPGEVGRTLRRLGAEITLEMSKANDDPRPIGYGEAFRLLLQMHGYLPEPADDLGTRRLRAFYNVLRRKPKRLQPRGLPDWGKP